MNLYDFVITPSEQRYVPEGAKEIIDIGQRVCTSATMTEAALKLGLEDLLETPPIPALSGDRGHQHLQL